MKSAFRNAYCASSRFSLNPSSVGSVLSTASAITITRPLGSPAPYFAITASARPRSAAFCSAPMASSDPPAPQLEKQFEGFRVQLEESGSLRDRIRTVAMEIESATRLMHSSLLLVHQSRPLPEVLDKAKAQIGEIKDHYSRLAKILSECPGQYYRYHGDWRSETQTVVSLLAFMHWLEIGNLLMHDEAEEKLGLNNSEFGLDIEDYLIGVCFMSNELPRYVVNQVTAGDYDCPRKVLKFLTDLNASFRMLNLRNDFLRKKFDSLKYDLRKVEEVYYDVKIRGLTSSGDSKEDQVSQGQQ
ncbi:translin isoform X1 [Punica granatum]|uniref:Translin isoform X1 n=1 Tax=Punica granatum TaxID=22663 RepID=A0A6P8DTH2_PUNGR|nr:translin isoform X1 [Punica granatum]